MNPTGKAATIGVFTGAGTPGLVDLVIYLWQFTGLPDLPESVTLLVAGVLAGALYRMLPASARPRT